MMNKEAYFWSLVDKNGPSGCWIWKGCSLKRGYGQVRFNGIKQSAHRMSWILVKGAILDGLWVLHKCDNPPCVNPEHLFLGTHEENVKDCVAKGRALGPRGEMQGNSKLTRDQVLEIRERIAEGESDVVLGQAYGVSGRTINDIRHRKRWAWL
jgi:hypothetical protein